MFILLVTVFIILALSNLIGALLKLKELNLTKKLKLVFVVTMLIYLIGVIYVTFNWSIDHSLIYVFGGLFVISLTFAIIDTMTKLKTRKLLDKSS